jgi:hypothetical protein
MTDAIIARSYLKARAHAKDASTNKDASTSNKLHNVTRGYSVTVHLNAAIKTNFSQQEGTHSLCSCVKAAIDAGIAPVNWPPSSLLS